MTVKPSLQRHIDEIFSDYQSCNATINEVKDHVKTLVSDLVDQIENARERVSS
jgi:hypothetical protein